MEAIILVVLVFAFLLFSAGPQKTDVSKRRRSTYEDAKGKTHRAPRTRSENRARPYRTEPCTTIQAPKTIRGKPYITDGDSLLIQKTEIRLFGVDAPEMKHPHGRNAKWALFNLCKGHEVRADFVDTDGHGRTVAKCYLPDGRDLSAEMVKLGLAIDWPKFSGGIYQSLEVPGARKKMWLADARQKGRMHVWDQFDARQKTRAANKA